ncbi:MULTISPECIES: isoamylase early set domain-containing protein [Kitasatospora]|uniref:Isoamylase early set domain-containing protein n=1 Tax=Kitasatospora cystarginea TaxID=58350 RepID=A0ABP5R7C9_9ACTN
MLERVRSKNLAEVTFVLPADHPAGETSVVGDFNDWTPGIHTFGMRPDGTRAVTVAMSPGERHAFRYLAHGDYWFDDQGADGHDGRNNILQT